MTEIGEGVSAGGGSGSGDDLEDNHWLELEYRYQSGAPIYGTFLATDSDGILWSGRLNDQGGVCLAGLPDGPVDVELLPEENAEDELRKTREEIQQILDRIVEDQREQADQHEAELAQQSGIQRTFTHVHRFGNGLWNGAVGVVEFVGTSVSKAAEVAHYILPLNQMQNLLSAGYKSYQDGELTWDEWHESLNSNLKRQHQEDIARLLGVEPEDVSQQGLKEAMNKVTEAYDTAAFIADDSDSREMLTQFAKDMADAQSSLDWAEFAGAGVFEIVLAALLAVFTGGAGNAAQAASKLRHAAHLRRLGHLFQKLARLLRLKKFNKKIEAPVDQKTTTKTDQPDPVELKAKDLAGFDDPRLKTASGPSPHSGLHNQAWPKGSGINVEGFKPHGFVDIDNLTEDQAAAARQLKKNGWDGEKVEQVLESGSQFRTKEYQKGDRLYGFTSEGFGKNLNNSPYWLDQEGLDELSRDYYSNGAWNREGVKNHLALPCYNRANAIDVAEVTEPHVGVESSINPADELLRYTNDNGSTGLMPKKMSGGGTQVALDPGKITSLKSQ